VSLTTEERNER